MSDSAVDQGKAGEVQLIQLGEKKMVGLSVVVAFKDGDFSQIGQTKERFLARKSEIEHIINSDTYWAPWYSCEVMFTYFYCMEVSELTNIPAGMMGFTIPEAAYAYVHYEGPHPMGPDPYGLLAAYRQTNNLTHKERGMVLEKYRFDNECIPDRHISVGVYGPIS
jgi:predicted transcriptional regulator YdeE